MTYQEYKAALKDLDEVLKRCTVVGGLTDLFYATLAQREKLYKDFWNEGV